MSAQPKSHPLYQPDLENIASNTDLAFFRVAFSDLSNPEWCPGLYRLFGVQVGDRRPVGGDMFHAFHPDDRGLVARQFAAIMKGAPSGSARVRIVRPSGEVRHVVSKLWRGTGPLGGPYIHGYVSDITGCTDEMLLASERAYRFVAENTHELILRVSADGDIQFASRACKRLLGYEPHEMIGCKGPSFIPEQWLEQIREVFSAQIAARNPEFSQTMEYQAIHKDGSLVWLESLPRLVFDGDGSLLGWIDVIRDITRRKEVEAQAEQDRIARQAAEEASNAKTAFISNMSHELRTPLNAIIGFAELLQEDAAADPDCVRADAHRIARAGRHLLDLINQVLDLGKIEAGMMEAQLGPVQLGELLDEVVETVAPLAARNRNRIILENKCTGSLYTDSRLLKQGLLNLVSNACKFTADGEIRIVVRIRGPRLELQVRDTGIGIAPDVAATLFQPFVQADNSSCRPHGGTGLGLALTRRFAQLLGGDVSLRSQVGKGSVFTMTVAARSDLDAQQAPALC